MKRRRIADLRSESGREHEEALLNFIDPAHKARLREVLKKAAAGRPPGNAGRDQSRPGADARQLLDVANVGCCLTP